MRWMLIGLSLVLSWQCFGAFKLFSMNLHCFKDRYEERLEHILTVVAELDPDVISLQEVCVYGKQDMRWEFLNKLQQKSGKKWYAQTYYTHLAWEKYSEFLMVVTQQKPARVIKKNLPHSYLQRAFIAVELDNQWYVNTHLAFHEDQVANRKEQINFLIEQFKYAPHVLMGDFNSNPANFEQASLTRAGYRAIFPKYSYPSHDLKVAIDGFWLSPGFQKRVGFFDTYFERPKGELYMSDHLAVFLSLL